MVERRSKRGAEEAERCSVSGCKDDAERSVSSKKYQGALPGAALDGAVGRRIGLCRRHYKDFRKVTKKDRQLDRLDW